MALECELISYDEETCRLVGRVVNVCVEESVLGEDGQSVEIVNRPPSRSKPLYMKVWEARRADGLDYDPEDPNQQIYVAQVTKYGLKNVD